MQQYVHRTWQAGADATVLNAFCRLLPLLGTIEMTVKHHGRNAGPPPGLDRPGFGAQVPRRGLAGIEFYNAFQPLAVEKSDPARHTTLVLQQRSEYKRDIGGVKLPR